MRFFKNKFQCTHKKEILFMSTITIRKKEYFYLSTFTIKQKKKKIDYSKCYYLLETLYIHIEENSFISKKKKKKKRKKRKKNLSQINIISMHY